MTGSTNYHKLIVIATGIFTLITGALIFIHPAAIFPDPSWGFQVLRGMQAGGGFNILPSPDTADLAKNNPSFLSWWSPGQYLVPYFFINLFKLNIGQANAVVATLGSLIGLTGLYTFFKRIGFTANISAISIAFITCQLAYLVPFVFYNGGEVLLFAFAGWFLYGCTYFNKANWLALILIFLSGVIGFFCKSSFVWIYFSGLIYLWIRLSAGQKITRWLINGISIGVPAVLAIAIIYFTYLSKGENPASDSDGLKLAWETFSFPLASPLLAGLSVDDLTNGIISHAGPALFNPFWSIVALLLLALVSVLLVIYCCKLIPYRNYKLLLIIFYIISVLFFGITFLRQANISYESRHLRIIGLIITPGIIYLIARLHLSYRVAFGLVWLYIAYAGFGFLSTGYHRNVHNTATGSTGIALLFIDQPILDAIKALDSQQRNAIFVFISPALGLEISHNRIITFDPLGNDLSSDTDIFTYAGHAGPIYMVLPKSYTGAKAQVYMKSFPGYHNFTMLQASKSYVIWMAK